MNHSVTILPAKQKALSTQEELRALELLSHGDPHKRQLLQTLRHADIKKLGLISGGALAALLLLNLGGRYQFYRGVVSTELKKQLSAVNQKLDRLQEENRTLREEVAQLRKESGEAPASK